MNKILIMGCGHMGAALLRAWITSTEFSFIIIDPEQYNKINKKFGNRVKAYNSLKKIKDLKSIKVIVIAVRPQSISKLMNEVSNYVFDHKTIFISIVAGKKINFFSKYLPKKTQFIRVMPNMPAIINESMSCLLPNKNVSSNNKKLINKLFLKIGKNLWLKKETEINKVTAISGSGPGYIFLIIDAFEKAALKLGLSKISTQKLVNQTLFGSINLFLKEKESAYKLAKKIAVKGGTTEAGLNEFEDKEMLHKLFKKVINSAYKRANELGR